MEVKAMTLILYEKLGEVVNPSGIIVTDEKVFKQYGITEIEVPDNITDYHWNNYMRRLYYVIDGKIHIKHVERRRL